MKCRLLPTIPALAFVVILSIPSTAMAKGTFDRIVVYGEGEATQVTDPSLLGFTAFNDFSSPYPGTPSVVGPGLLIVREGTDANTGEFVPFDTLRLFPTSLGTGSPPVVFYEGLVNGWSEYDSKWYTASPEATASLQELIASTAGDSSAAIGPSFTPIAIAGIVGFALGIGTMALLKRPRRPRLDASA